MDKTELLRRYAAGQRDFSYAILCGIDLRGFELPFIDLSYADLREANLSGANLAGVEMIQTNLNCAHLNHTNLIAANLTRSTLRGAKLEKAILSTANLTKATLSYGNLDYACLNSADLNSTNCRGASFQGVDLCDANLKAADLKDANMSGAEWVNSDFTGAILPNGKRLLSMQDFSPKDLTHCHHVKQAKKMSTILHRDRISASFSRSFQDRIVTYPFEKRNSQDNCHQQSSHQHFNLSEPATNAAEERVTETEWLTTVTNSAQGQQADRFPDYAQRHSESKVISAIRHRRGQFQFRQMLLKIYKKKCAITGCNAVPVLEAALIIPHTSETVSELYTPGNGLLLRSDIHLLFDLYLITINPDTMRVLISPELKMTQYEKLADLKLHLPDQNENHPSRELLKQHLYRCSWLDLAA